MVPCEVSAVKLGASSLIRNTGFVVSLLAECRSPLSVSGFPDIGLYTGHPSARLRCGKGAGRSDTLFCEGDKATMRIIATQTRGILLGGLLVCAHAQWLNYTDPGVPRTRDGEVNLSAPAPRASNSQPDLSGVWQVEPPPGGAIERMLGPAVGALVVQGDDPREFSPYFFNILADFKPEDAPMRPEAAERLRQRRSQGPIINTESHCLPMGIPRADLITVPFKIIQAPKEVVILYEGDNTHRHIHTDGRKLPADPDPTWLGYSVGRWDAGALVVETAGLNDKILLDAFGHPRSESTHMTERFRRRDFGHLEIELTIDDPVNYTKPFTIKFTTRLHPDTDVQEAFCTENEQDLRHLG